MVNVNRTTGITCSLCHFPQTRTLFTAQGKHIVRCQRCRIVQTYPRPSETLYQQPAYFVERNRYLERAHEFEEGFGRLLDRVQHYALVGSLLDVGCGAGTLLDVARRRGFDVHGVEISEWAVRYAREELGLPVVQGALQAEDFAGRMFDVVVANHSLEHMPDPKQTLRVIHTILKDDGLLVIGIPNFGSFMAQVKRSAWQSLLPEQHVWHFTPTTITAMLRDAGFAVLNITTEDHRPATRNRLKQVLRRTISWISERGVRGEAMLVLARKQRQAVDQEAALQH